VLWKLRNTALHGVTFTESEATRRTRVEPLVRQLYNRIYELNPSDRVMFTKPLDERLKQPMSIIETWLSLIQPAFDAARETSLTVPMTLPRLEAHLGPGSAQLETLRISLPDVPTGAINLPKAPVLADTLSYQTNYQRPCSAHLLR
jgi:hypothetical protein